MRKQAIKCSIISISCLLVFFTNNLCFKKLDISYNYPFIRNHLNDTLATVFLFSCIALLRTLRKRRSYINFVTILAVCTVASIMWEYVAQFVKPESTFDYIDILCYFMGGAIYYLIQKIISLSP